MAQAVCTARGGLMVTAPGGPALFVAFLAQVGLVVVVSPFLRSSTAPDPAASSTAAPPLAPAFAPCGTGHPTWLVIAAGVVGFLAGVGLSSLVISTAGGLAAVVWAIAACCTKRADTRRETLAIRDIDLIIPDDDGSGEHGEKRGGLGPDGAPAREDLW